MKAVENSSTAIGIRCKDGVVFGVEKLVLSKLYEEGSNKRIFNIDRHVGMAVAGLLADARSLSEIAREEASNFRSNYGHDIPLKHLADRVAMYVHAYTLYSAVRPFGCSFMLGSYDEDDGPQLYMVDPSGVSYVLLKGDNTSQVVQDDQVKGPLRVGSTVEVKSPDGLFHEGVISKLTDASWYTVVFDDGDERTLRRTSLCLKGERHFAESETLDQLPLTNPEHFGTPVIGKKTNRGRRSSLPVAEDEKEEESSEEEDDDKRRLNDELLGKISCVQSSSDKTASYIALVISPSCSDDLAIKKDQCLVRSFADSKFYTVARKDVHELDANSISKPEYSTKKGHEEAQLFLKARTVPESWKMDMSEILESSSSDEEDGGRRDSEDDEEKEVEVEEPEEEPDPEERDHFLQQLYKFMEDRGTPINKPPVLGYKDLNLFKLFRLVYHQGGCDNIESGAVWKQIYMDLGIPILNSAASYNVKTAYRKYLYGFEEYCRSACIEFRTIHHNDPKPAVKVEKKADVTEVEKDLEEEEEEEVSEDQEEAVGEEALTGGEEKPLAEESNSSSESEKEEQKEIRYPRGRRRCTVTPVRSEGKDAIKLERVKESEQADEVGDGKKDRQESEIPGKRGPPRAKAERRSRRLEESDRESEEEEQDEQQEEEEEEEEEDEEEEEERGKLRERGERENKEEAEEDGEEDHCLTGTKVKVKYGRGKTQKIYEANIKNTEMDDGEVLYLVHYYGWNVRYDEWVKADRIIWPVDKSGTKRKQKKRVKNKDEGEKEEKKEEEKQSKSKRGRPPLKSTPPSSSRSVSKTPSSDGRASCKSARLSDASALPNGIEGTPRRRTRRTSGMTCDSDRGSNDSGNSSEESEAEDTPGKKADRVDIPEAAQGGEAEDDKSSAEERELEQECPRSPQEQRREPPVLSEEEEQAEEKETEKSPKPRGRRSRSKEPSSESSKPPTTNHTESTDTCLLTPEKAEPAEIAEALEDAEQELKDSDTDSASEEVCKEDKRPVKRKAGEPQVGEKKVRLEKREEQKTVSPEKKMEVDGIFRGGCEDSLPDDIVNKMEMPSLTLEVVPPIKDGTEVGPEKPADESELKAEEELMPQIGLEALMCHEVDLDDLDEKEKPPSEETVDEKSRALSLADAAAGSQQGFPVASPAAAPSPDESHSTKSESDTTIEVDSVAGESQEGLCESESANGFDASTSSSNCSLSLQERDSKDRGQKRSMDCNNSLSAKKQKRNQKRTSVASKNEKNGAGHSSDSEDLPAIENPSKCTPVKHSGVSKANKLARSPARVTSPSSKDADKEKHREKHAFPSPRTYKWTFQLTELDSMTSTERIAFLQDKLQEIRKYYMSLKSEVASIDRRRKRLKKKEREGKIALYYT
ncbi:ARI4A protein, partial [Atractosteus spatula]|nr:ARI4A protein [Atractosteus spatula]